MKFLNSFLGLVLLAFMQILQAQQSVKSILPLFSQKKQVEWAVQTDRNESVPVKWYERESSFAVEGIRTFVGYYNEQLVGALSVQRNDISGSIQWVGKAYHIDTRQGKVVISTSGADMNCGTCSWNFCASDSAEEKSFSKVDYKKQKFVYTDPVLRVYRLAITIDYSYFSRTFGFNKARVRGYWASAEVVLNELYMRDLAMKFKVINDDRLIIDTKDKELFNTTNFYYIISNSTQKINGLIGENNYEVGVMVTEPAKGVLGIATLGGFYNKSTKGSALVSNNNYTLAHEVGHLFGSKHTFSNGPITYSTEPLSGTSIMGYGFKDDDVFFSLVSASKIKERVFYNPGYYSDEEHKHWVGEKSAAIPFYGINTNNRPPLINRAKLQPEYKIPPDTFFQFRIDATDPEDDALLYMAHQADIDQPGKANFIAYSPSKDNTVKYEAKYERVLTNPGNDDGEDEYEIQKVPYSSPEPSDRGVYTFWLGVSDGGRKAHQQPHATQYDIEKVNLNIVDGTPFKITSVMPLSNMEEGDNITIKWDVDRNIFGNDTKVRILFSDDYGKTYKYVLADEVPNNGEYKVSLPAGIRKAGKVWSWGSERTKHKVEGIFKVEVIDHIAYALYTRRSLKEPSPKEVYEPKIVFKNLPEPVITVKKNEIPPKAEVTATSSCSGTGNNIPNIDYKEENHLHYILRKWEATDNCGNKNSFTQYIYIEKDRLKFVGDLPKDIHLQYKDSQLPEVPKLEVTGGDESTKIEFTEEKIDLWNGNYKLIRSWYASADKVSPVAHSQVILVQDTTPPELSDYPKDQIVKTEADIPAQQGLTAVDNCDGAVKVSQGWEAGELNGKKQKKYVWLAEDRSGNVNRYVQTFTIDPDDAGLSTDEVEVKSLRIYPNPVKDSFVVEGVEGDFNLKIYDLSGKQFKSFGKMQRYIVSDLPAGVYIVNVEADNILHTFKIIKK